MIVVVFLLIAVVVAVLLLNKKSTNKATEVSTTEVQGSNNTPTESTRPTQLAPVAKIAKELAQYKVPVSDIKDPESINKMAYFFEGTEGFSIIKAKTFEAYQFEDDSAYEVTEDYCSSFAAKYDIFVMNAKKYFTEEGFTATDVKMYTQYNDCGKAFIATKNNDTCFVRYLLEGDMTNKKNVTTGFAEDYIGMRVFCSELSDLKEDISKAKEIALIVTEGLGQTVKQLLYNAEYIKDAVTPGYRIAYITDQGPGYPIYFFKSSTSKWTLVETNNNGGMLCVQKAALVTDFSKAFKDEVCYTSDGTKSTVK